MTKKKSTKPCPLAQIVPMSEWSKTREKERITYSDADRPASWQSREVYKPKELSYRGQQPRVPKITLAGRPL